MKNTKNSPLNSEGGKWGQRDPGTGYSQKEKLSDRAGHSKAVSEGYHKALPLIGSVVGAIAPIPGAGIVGRVVGRVLGKTLQTSARNFSSAVKQFLGKGKVATKPRLVDQYHTVDRGAIKKFNQLQQSTSGSAKVATKPINPRLVAKAKGNPSYLSIAKADKSVANTFSERQSAYLRQQMKQREVGSASSRLQKTHQKAVGNFYAGKGPKIPPVKGKWWPFINK